MPTYKDKTLLIQLFQGLQSLRCLFPLDNLIVVYDYKWWFFMLFSISFICILYNIWFF